MKVFQIIIVLIISLPNHLFAQGLYCETNKKTNLILPNFKTEVKIEKGVCFMILNSYKEFFLVTQLNTNTTNCKGYLSKSDVKIFIKYNIKKGGSLQSFVPNADTISYEKNWNDSTIQKWNRIAGERDGEPYGTFLQKYDTFLLKDSL